MYKFSLHTRYIHDKMTQIASSKALIRKMVTDSPAVFYHTSHPSQFSMVRSCFIFVCLLDRNLWWLRIAVGTTADGIITRYKWLLAAYVHSPMGGKTGFLCGEFSVPSASPTGVLGNIRLGCCQNQHQTCCAKRSINTLKHIWWYSIRETECNFLL